ncbi:hypothetical protein Ahy_B08g089399 [Arachis hypogaea]|uniref:Uncharacterized protein n=1 Tax=Arachis hypogaea TaxID=3818 RepID=A0A444XXT8_ARAHY|nr:hypothetical protein Ahy_B08g089399 [Arachis hypogaea]
MHLANNHHIPFLSSPKLTQSSIQSSSLHILHSNPNSSKPPTTTRSDTPCIHKSYVGDVSSAISAFSVMNTTAALSRLQNDDTLYDLFLFSFSPTLAEIADL